jgi:pimeloyl-ACP methyl ester carboxylesterase
MLTVRTDDGVAIAYREKGDGSLPLLFLHGWGGSGAYFDEMIGHLDLTGLRVLTPSFRGHGDSEKPTAGYTIDRFARDMFAVADHAEAERFVLVGFSMSGKYAQYMTVTEPSRVLAQVLIAPCPAAEFPIPEEMGRSWCDCHDDPRRVPEILAPLIKVPVNPSLMDAFVAEFRKVPRFALEKTLDMLREMSFLDEVKGIRAPTLVVGGSADPMLPPDYLRRNIVDLIPKARLALLDCGHETPQELPAGTAAILEAFLAGLGRPGAAPGSNRALEASNPS